MIRRLIDRVLGRRRIATTAYDSSRPAVRRQARQYTASQLGLTRDKVPTSALRTCDTLQQAGYKAYIVGGGVRDSMLGLCPKDFDVATDATPEQVTRVFRRARIIGRRFQIVHVLFGREMIETSTFRAIQADAQTDEHGRVLRDNVWGTLEEDAARRDFTVNALYYDPVADLVIDYHDGVPDPQNRIIRMIGDPATRYREDPVRLLRSARFAAKLGFAIEPHTRSPIRELGPLLRNVPPARLFDEILKLLESGHALKCLHQLRVDGLHHGLLPLLDVILEQPDGERFITAALTRTDQRIAEGKSVSPGFLFATLLWQQVAVRWKSARARGEPDLLALTAAIDSVLDEQAEQLAMQKRIVADMREIWSLQPRFERRTGRSPFRLLEHIRLRAGYDFLLLRVESGELPAEIGDWWTRFIDADEPEREALMRRAPASTGSPTRSRRRRKSRAGNETTAVDPSPCDTPAIEDEVRAEDASPASQPLRKRRPRRRSAARRDDTAAGGSRLSQATGSTDTP
jgi:poly(A) polymerase